MKRQTPIKEEIKHLVRLYYQIQKHRVALNNQIFALQQQGKNPSVLMIFHDKFFDNEKEIVKYLREYLKKEPIYTEFLKQIKGIGPVLSAGLISVIDIYKAQHISSLWKYAGYHVVDGKAPRPKRGEKVDWNPFLKTLCWKIGMSFLKTKSPYVAYYKEAKAFYENRDKNLSKLHIHYRALRKMIKRFLADLWVEWRRLEGLPITPPYGERFASRTTCSGLSTTFYNGQ